MEVNPATASAPLPSPAETAASLVRSRRWALAWLLAWSGLTVWAAHGLATAWPYELHPLLLLLALALPGVLFRATDLLWMHRWGRRLAGWRRAAARLAAVPPGVALAFLLFSQLDTLSMGRFEREMALWVGQLQVTVPLACPADGRLAADAALNAYLDRSGAIRRVTLHQGAGRFVLELMGRSIDIDGSTLYYDSATGKWQRFHNDNRERADALAVSVQSLEACRFTLY